MDQTLLARVVHLSIVHTLGMLNMSSAVMSTCSTPYSDDVWPGGLFTDPQLISNMCSNYILVCQLLDL